MLIIAGENPRSPALSDSPEIDGFCKQLGIITSSSIKILMMGLKKKFLGILPTDNWLDGAGAF